MHCAYFLISKRATENNNSKNLPRKRWEGGGGLGRGDEEIRIFTLYWYNSGIQHKMTLKHKFLLKEGRDAQ